MKKLFDNLFTGAVLICLVSSAYLAFYLRPWRWHSAKRGSRDIPDNPFADLPLPDSAERLSANAAEKAIV